MITLGQLINATNSKEEFAKKFYPFINQTMEKYEINTPIRQLTFLAQIGHESGGLYYTEEIASGAKYEGRNDLGNINLGDGRKFKGRGLIQITGRFNYSKLKEAFEIDFINNPKLLGGLNVKKCTEIQLKYSALSAGWFWNKEKLNDIADLIDINKKLSSGSSNRNNFIKITRKINGGENGLEDRLSRYVNGRPYFTDKIFN
ncbi:MAG: glycoside hydrolase family 19 protein [Limnohabitans sp.]|nr:glycoside hydrolase family 19 protein [Limnohabitans sp.]